MARDQGLLPTAMGGATWEQSSQPSRAFRWCKTPARAASRLPRAPAQGNCEVTMSCSGWLHSNRQLMQMER